MMSQRTVKAIVLILAIIITVGSVFGLDVVSGRLITDDFKLDTNYGNDDLKF